MIPQNVNISNVSRVVGANRYGQPKRGVVATGITGFLKHDNSVNRNADGSFSRIDATLIITTKLEPQDKVTLDNGDQYNVHRTSAVTDILGNVKHYTCDLTKVLTS